MAAPHVNGTIALLLQKNSRLTPIEIRDLLETHGRSDKHTGSTPNSRWGAGKLDAEASFSACPPQKIECHDFGQSRKRFVA